MLMRKTIEEITRIRPFARSHEYLVHVYVLLPENDDSQMDDVQITSSRISSISRGWAFVSFGVTRIEKKRKEKTQWYHLSNFVIGCYVCLSHMPLLTMVIKWADVLTPTLELRREIC